MLQFIYTNKVSFEDPNDSVDLLMASQSLFLDNLRKLCEICVKTSLELDEYDDVETMAEQAINAYQGGKILGKLFMCSGEVS